MSAMNPNEWLQCELLGEPPQHLCNHHRFTIGKIQFTVTADGFYPDDRVAIYYFIPLPGRYNKLVTGFSCFFHGG